MTRRQAVRVFDRPTVADWQVADFDEVKRLLVRHLLAIVRQDGQRVAAGAEVEVAIVEDYGDLFIRNKVAMVATVDVVGGRLAYGRYRVAVPWMRWCPIIVGPVFEDRAHPFRTACGVSVSFFRWGFYVMRGL